MNSEQAERKYLKQLLRRVDETLRLITQRLQDQKKDIDDIKHHLQDHKRDMDHLEKNAVRQAVSDMTTVGEASAERRNRLYRLRDIPYFGRIDFQERGAKQAQPVYVGVHHFQDEQSQQHLVYDWRAPISSMFYDYELGEARYETSSGEVEGEILLKRQYRIRQGAMEYMLESDLTIQDEVLQKELNQASSSQMRNIVATIQREQNAIIRNEEAYHLIIQGVAGSGKTSIALHRIAFLLYKYKDTISSEDILIISPNKVFASYISNVLPELGEESVAETSMEEIADQLLEYQIPFQPFLDQVAELLEKTKPQLIERIQFKSSPDMIKRLDEYFLHLENTGFQPEDIMVAGKPVPGWFIEEKFWQYSRMPLLKRFNEVVREVVQNVFLYYQIEVTGKERTELHKKIRRMFPATRLRQLYKGFYQWLARPELLKMRKGSTYEYADVYPLLYLKMKLEGLSSFQKVKHLVVDEMQDYSPVQYQVLKELFPARKTILGDINQSVNPFSSSNLERLQAIFPDATAMTMTRSYRSTTEITEFSKKISDRVTVQAIERHGPPVEVKDLADSDQEGEYLRQQMEEFEASELHSLGIICKTHEQARGLYEAFKGDFHLKLLEARSTAFGSGIVITTAHLAKGLEFDQVLIPAVSSKNYRSAPDQQMLYVACTRAMHRLALSYVAKPSPFIAG